MSITAIAVIIPAFNEEELISDCLAAVLDALAGIRQGIRTTVVVVDNGSSDETAGLARSVLPGNLGLVVRHGSANVGLARRMGVTIAMRELATDPDETWLAFTDADTLVPEDWLQHQLSLAEAGYDAVAGIISLASSPTPSTSFVRQYLGRVFGGRHEHIHGANLGVRASAYLRVGGFAPLNVGEDVDLWHRLKDTQARLISDTRLVVETSFRLSSRVEGGFATRLSEHAVQNPSSFLG